MGQSDTDESPKCQNGPLDVTLEEKALVFARAELAKYDEEMAEINDYMVHNNVFAGMSNEEVSKVNATRESAKQFRIDNKDKYIAIRNALLQ